METDEEEIRVPENHRRGISATLGVLNHDLTQFRRWAEGGEVASILFVEENNLSPAQRSSILATVSEIERELCELHGSLGLKGQRIDISRVIEVKCGFLWEGIEELRGQSLRRYGETPADLASYMDAKVERLTELLRNITQVVNRRSNHGNETHEQTE